MNAEPIKKQNFEYKGDGTEFAILTFANWFLVLITIGIYSPWARTNTRKFLWSNTYFAGEKAHYSGTGEELFWGWVKLWLIYFFGSIILALAAFLMAFFPLGGLIANLAIYTLWTFIFALATYAGTRYLLSRTQFRNMNFGVRLNVRQYLKSYFIGAFFTVVTLGIYYPFFAVEVRRMLTNHSRFGNKHFKFNGVGADYFRICAIGYALTFLTLGFYYPWLKRNQWEFKAKNTQIENSRFDFELKGSDLLFFGIFSWILTIATVGIAKPWLDNYYYKMMINATSLVGDLDLSTIENIPSTGDAISDYLDSDLFSLDI
jgi:uncharacterized membrane protein YjgN (DUF898 family)